MSEPNPYITNGTCYHGQDEESPSDILPCGNAALTTRGCCQAGDMCVGNNFCYSKELDITYQAGCSDPDYAHDKCDDMGSNGMPSCLLLPPIASKARRQAFVEKIANSAVNQGTHGFEYTSAWTRKASSVPMGARRRTSPRAPTSTRNASAPLGTPFPSRTSTNATIR